MSKYHQGPYIPINPEKYLGKKQIFCRSSWEFRMCNFLDTNPNILGWSSEAYRIPYIHPITGKKTTYVPDFFVIYRDANGNTQAELIEVKPKRQMLEYAKRKSDKLAAIVNAAKWEMAMQWCQQQGIKFRIITEDDIFRNPSKK